MARQIINIGTTPNDGTGDTVRNAFDKVNDNFDEVYNDLFVPLSGTDAGAPITGEVVFDDDVYATFNSSAGAADLLSINGNGLAIQGENSTSVLNQFGLSCTGGNTGSIIQQVYNYGDGVQTFNFPILGSTDNFIVNWPAKSGTVAMTSDINAGTVTSVGLTTGTSGTDINVSGSPITSSGSITLNIPTASATNRGVLSSADWTTFNNKQNALTNPVIGTGTNGHVAFWSGTNSQQGSVNLFWNNANGRLRIGGAADNGNTLQISGNTSITPLANTTGLTLSGYSLTGANDQPAIDLSGTWNTTGTPTLIRANVTDTASNAASILMALQVNGNTLYRFRKDSVFSFGPSLIASIRTTLNGTFDIRSQATGTESDFILQNGALGSRSHTSGSTAVLTSNIGYVPTSGNGSFAFLGYSGIINQTGGASGVTRGIFLTPTLTSAADWRSIEWSNNTGRGLWGAGTANNAMAGALNVGSATNANASAILELTSTTRGFLPPRMTTTERNAIAAPAAGLVIYNTTDNKHQGYDGTNWNNFY